LGSYVCTDVVDPDDSFPEVGTVELVNEQFSFFAG
jgi:hypothetical protein